MADLKEDWIDFAKLEKELDQAVQKDARYWRENDAKFRAVAQRVETYEEFRDIVKAAHIKPLERNDKIGEGRRNQPWNPYTSKTSGPEPAKAGDAATQDSEDLPKTGHDFTKCWRSRGRTDGERYRLLLRLGADRLGKIFRAEISFGLLGELLSVLARQLGDGDGHRVVGILESLAATDRFGLAVDFLGREEQERCTELFRKLEGGTMETRTDAEAGNESGTTIEQQDAATSKTELSSEAANVDTSFRGKLILLRKDYNI